MTIDEVFSDPEGALNKLFPTVNLADVFENNGWHVHESVLDHTLNVLRAVESFADPEKSPCRMSRDHTTRLSEYLSRSIDGSIDRFSLLKLAALLHDIGKPSTLLVHQDHTTSCPGHAAVSRRLFEKARGSLDLTDAEGDFVGRLIAEHHEADEPMGALSSQEISRGSFALRTKVGPLYVELLLLFIADFEGSLVSSEVAAKRSCAYRTLCELVCKALDEIVS